MGRMSLRKSIACGGAFHHGTHTKTSARNTRPHYRFTSSSGVRKLKQVSRTPMTTDHARRWWVGAFGVLSSALLLGACASIPFDQTNQPATKPAAITQSEHDDWDQ